MEEIRPLTGITFDELFGAWEEAFRDYERTRTRAELKKLLQRRGYAAELSFGAFAGDELLSFTLNGVGQFGGKPTVYDTGTGTIPDHRGRGLATKIFTASLPALRQAGMQQYVLEVLQHNVKAITVYSNLGFKVSRELNYFMQNADEVQLGDKSLPMGIRMKETDLTRKDEMMPLWDFSPTWQNNFAAIERCPKDFYIAGAFDHDYLIGYGIIETAGGDIPQLAVDNDYRRKGIGTCLLKELLKRTKHKKVQVINTEVSCEPITSFLESSNILKRGMQFEMIKDL